MGKSSSQTIGYWYYVAYHAGLGIGPIDAFLEFRGGDKTAWSGNLTASGTISINQPALWGGEKDQGGIVSDVDVMFGEATQEPNAYLLSALGTQVPAWRGLATLVFKGGKYGAMNPYPQKPAYKIKRITKGWDNDACWYPEIAEVSALPPLATGVWRHVEMSCDDNTVRLFVDGQLKASSILDYAPNGGSGGQSTIGRYSADASDGGVAHAYLRNVRVTKAVRHTANFSPTRLMPNEATDPLWDETIMFLPMNGANGSTDFTDEKGSPWTVHDGLASMSSDTSIDGTTSGFFDGGNIRTPYTSALNVGSKFTIDFWVNPAQLSGCFVCINQLHSIHAGYSVSVLGDGSIQVTFGRNTWPAAPVVITENVAVPSGWMNPAHILYYARTQQDMGREPTANMNDASFRAAADWYASQGFGLCTDYDPAAETVDDFISRIEKVAGCSMTISPVDGLWYLDIANGIYDLDSLPILTDDDILDFSETPTLQDSAINSLSVEFFDPDLKDTRTTAPVQAMALIDAFGTIHDQASYPEVPTYDLALRLAARDLRANVTPSRAFEITTTRLPYDWRVDTYFRLQSAKRGIADMVCLLAEKSSGTLKSGAIKITASQDIYSLPTASFVDAEHGVDTRPSQIPLPITAQSAFEAPYIEVCGVLSRADLAALPADVGYLMAVAAEPAVSRDFSLMVSTGGDYAETSHGDWCATALVVEASGFDDVTFTLVNSAGLPGVVVGMPALWGSEIVRVDAIDPAAGTITLGRSCGDTVGVKHDARERIWFYAVGAAADITEYTDGETIDAKLLTNTGSQQLDIASATAIPVTFASRAARPYPPGQLRINGQVDPANIVGAVAVTGVHRDRVQQADQLVDSEMAAVGPEPGTTYTARYYLNGSLVHTDAALAVPSSTYAPDGAGILRVEFESSRDGLASYQMHVREFAVGLPLLDESGDPVVTEDEQIIIMG